MNISIVTKVCGLFLFFSVNNRALEASLNLSPEKEVISEDLKLMFESAAVESELSKNICALSTIYAAWITLGYFNIKFVFLEKGLTFKSLSMSAITGAWIAVSINWYKYLMNNKDVLEAKSEFYKEAIKQIQSFDVTAEQASELQVR